MTDARPISLSGYGAHNMVVYHRVFLSERHLILTEGPGLFRPFTETTREFLLSDLQGITITRTASGFWINILLAVLGLIGLPCFAESEMVPVACGWLVIVALFLAFHLSRGATCKVIVHTAVSHEHLGGWSRLRAARKGLAVLIPAIERAQKDLALRQTGSVAAAPEGTPPPPAAG